MDSGVLQDTLKWLGQLPPVKGAVAGAIALLTPIAGVVAKEAVTAWMRDRARKQESAKMDDEQTGQHASAGREDTAVIALRRIATDAQRDSEALRHALQMSERESEHLRARVNEAERELATTASELAAKTYALEASQAERNRLRTRVRELEEERRAILSGHTRPVTDEPPDLRTSQRPTPVSGLHGVVPEVRVPRPARVPDDPDQDTPRPRGLPPMRPGKR